MAAEAVEPDADGLLTGPGPGSGQRYPDDSARRLKPDRRRAGQRTNDNGHRGDEHVAVTA
jgi:hypothetical protein